MMTVSVSISCANETSLFGGGSGGVVAQGGTSSYTAVSAKGGNGLATIERIK
jgi:hypothetical protein